MGNRKFKLSAILPAAWFSKPRPPPPPPPDPRLSGRPHASPRKSYHIARELKKPRTPRTLAGRPTSDSSTPTTKFSSSTTSSSAASLFRPPEPADDDDIVIDVDKLSLNPKTEGSILGFELAPIKTERRKDDAIDDLIKEGRRFGRGKGAGANGSFQIKVVKEESMASKEQRHRCIRKVPTGSPRVRLRVNSPRIGRRAQINSGRKSISSSTSKKSILSESLALAKSSFDPQRDFRESMIEMIVMNDIRASKDLEELLACYLSLNSEEYHDLIVEAFRQIWFDLNTRCSRRQK